MWTRDSIFHASTTNTAMLACNTSDMDDKHPASMILRTGSPLGWRMKDMSSYGRICILLTWMMLCCCRISAFSADQRKSMPMMIQTSQQNNFSTVPVIETGTMTRSSFLQSIGWVAMMSGMAVSPAGAMSNDPTTGIALPDVGEISSAIPKDWSDVENPFAGGTEDAKTMFGRLDSKPDSIFYAEPKLVEHVDENAVRLMTDYISNRAVTKGDAVLDLCSSWTSHITPSTASSLSSIKGLGMNAKELQSNPILTESVVQDLNENPKLPYNDASFDVVLCQLSIDYLTKPLEVLKEVGRVLKPNGKVHILFSNRLFLTKAVGLWTGADDIDHAYYVGCYLHFCQGGFQKITAEDLSTRQGRAQRIVGDPLYVVTAQIGGAKG